MVQPWPRYHWPEGRDSAFCFTVDVDADSPYLWSQRAPEATRSLGQLEQRSPGVFAVDYLERGPEVWRLRLVRKAG